MEPWNVVDMDNFLFLAMLNDESDSDQEELICKSCARGRQLNSMIRPRLPDYKVVYQKKCGFKTDLGIAVRDISKRVLGRGRARAAVPKVPIPGGGVEQNSESSADKRNIGASINNTKFKNLKELRQPKSIPKILNQDFPQLTVSCQTETNVTQLKDETVSTKDTTNLQDMAKFLMDSWQDEVGDEGQFDDSSVQTSSSKGDNSDRMTDDEKKVTLQNNTELKDDPTVEEKTEEYFNKLTNEVDGIDLDDFENIQVSGISDLESEKQDKSMKSSKMKSKNSNCSSIDVEYDSYSDNSVDYDLSDDTSVSFSTDSLLPYDKSSIHNRNSDSDNVPNAIFDLTLPTQVNICRNAIPISSHEENDSTLSISNTESESKRTSFTSEKDESENNEAWTKLSRKEKKKMRDVLRAKAWHDKYPEKGKQSVDSDSLEVIKCQNNKSISNTSKINGTLDVPHCHRWKLEGQSVIQIDGLPVNCDISALQDLIASYGTVIDSEKKSRSQSSSVRFRLNNDDACEMVVSCLDDTDIFPDAVSKISCVLVQ